MPLIGADYPLALKLLRSALQLPWKLAPAKLPPLNWTLHSLKTTLLSWSVQRPEISDDDRLAQGHHRGGSLQLYSRDRVIGQLRVQIQLRRAVLSGKCFLIPQHRGSQLPIEEPAVQLESYRKEQVMRWHFFKFPCDLREGILPDCPGASSSDSSQAGADIPDSCLPGDLRGIQSEDELSSDASECDPNDPALLGSEYDEFTFGACAQIIHAMIPASSNGLQLLRRRVKSACGVQMHQSTFLEVQPDATGYQLCRRLACLAIFSASGVPDIAKN